MGSHQLSWLTTSCCWSPVSLPLLKAAANAPGAASTFGCCQLGHPTWGAAARQGHGTPPVVRVLPSARAPTCEKEGTQSIGPLIKSSTCFTFYQVYGGSLRSICWMSVFLFVFSPFYLSTKMQNTCSNCSCRNLGVRLESPSFTVTAPLPDTPVQYGCPKIFSNPEITTVVTLLKAATTTWLTLGIYLATAQDDAGHGVDCLLSQICNAIKNISLCMWKKYSKTPQFWLRARDGATEWDDIAFVSPSLTTTLHFMLETSSCC